jgi:hypothetical protein
MNSSQQDISQRFASIDAQLGSIKTQLAALEAKRDSAPPRQQVSTVSHSTPRPHVTSNHRARPQHEKKQLASASPEPQPAQPARVSTAYKAMAVVGDRAWVRASDGSEDSVTNGDSLPVARPRVRSIDQSNGIVITSSDERIETH